MENIIVHYNIEALNLKHGQVAKLVKRLRHEEIPFDSEGEEASSKVWYYCRFDSCPDYKNNSASPS